MNTHVLSNSVIKIVVLTLVLSAVLTVKFITAWTGPTATAPGNNVAAPINVTGTYQNKPEEGGIGAGYFRTDNYCNAIGNACGRLFGGMYVLNGDSNCEETNPLAGNTCTCPSEHFTDTAFELSGLSIHYCHL